MSKVVVFNHVTLDGVMQAPGRKDEDPRGGFPYGGWAMERQDAVMGQVAGGGVMRGGGLLLGRRTWEQFAAFWPKQTNPNPFTDVLNKTTKYVASRTLQEPLPWENSVLLQGDIAETVAKLKAEGEKDLVVMGSGDLIQTLLQHQLIDRFVLMIHPLLLGTGRRLFPEGTPHTALKLVDSRITTTGVVIATYE